MTGAPRASNQPFGAARASKRTHGQQVGWQPSWFLIQTGVRRRQ